MTLGDRQRLFVGLGAAALLGCGATTGLSADQGVLCLAAAVLGWPPLVAGAALSVGFGGAGSPSGVLAGLWCVVSVGCSRDRRRWVVLGMGLLIALKQAQVITVLPTAAAGIAPAVVLGVLGAGAVSAPLIGLPLVRVALGGLAALCALQLVAVAQATGEQKLRLAVRHRMAEAVAPVLMGQGRRLDYALMVAVPSSDRVAASAGWRRALDLGWRPRRPTDDVLSVADELVRRGRGGEAERVLARYPRRGAVDFYRTLLARAAGGDGWRGGLAGEPQLQDRLALDWALTRNGVRERTFWIAEAGEVSLLARAEAFEGVPEVSVRTDHASVRWAPVGVLCLGRLAAGPHRLTVVYDTDRVGSAGDRNVWVDALVMGCPDPLSPPGQSR